MAMGLLGGLYGMGMCMLCNSHSCHHLMQGQQQSINSQYENYLRQQMGIQQFSSQQQQHTRSFDIAEAVDKHKEDKKRKLLLLLR